MFRRKHHIENALSSLRGLRGQVDAWMRGRLWAQVLAGLALGVVVGYLLGPDPAWVSRETAQSLGAWLALPGNLFLGLISMVLVPLVIGSIVDGVTGPKSAGELKHIGARFLIYVVVTTTLAAALGIALANRFRPGDAIAAVSTSASAGVPLPIPAESRDEAQLSNAQEEPLAAIPKALVNMLPTNPVVAFSDLDMLAIVVLALIFGLAARASRPERVSVVLRGIEGMLEISMRVVKWAMYLTPWAVFGLMAQLIANVGLSTLSGMTVYVSTVLLGLLGLLLLYVVLVALVARRSPFGFLRAVSDPVLLAFSTSSSAAVMPLSIDTAVQKLGVSESAASLVVPLGATINMAGTALYQSVAIVFLAQAAGLTLSLGQQVAIVVTLVASSIGAPGTPGVGIVILGNVAGGFGIPLTALPLVLGIDRILDMSRTAVNLTGDLTATVLFGNRP